MWCAASSGYQRIEVAFRWVPVKSPEQCTWYINVFVFVMCSTKLLHLVELQWKEQSNALDTSVYSSTVAVYISVHFSKAQWIAVLFSVIKPSCILLHSSPSAVVLDEDTTTPVTLSWTLILGWISIFKVSGSALLVTRFLWGGLWGAVMMMVKVDLESTECSKGDQVLNTTNIGLFHI